MFSPWDYTWTTTGPGLIMVGSFVAVFLSVTGLVYLNYPDMPAYPREFEGGLERELGGPGALRVCTSTQYSCVRANMVIAGEDGERRCPIRRKAHMYISNLGN